MRVLLLGGNGFLGPHVVEALEDKYDLRITDVVPINSVHENAQVDVANFDQMREVAEGTDVIVNCSVSRNDRRLAFDVNTCGTWNALRVATELGHQRFINTGPRFTMVGPRYLSYDFGIVEDVPPHPGTGLYALSKSLGQTICQSFAASHSIHVLTLIFSTFSEPRPPLSWNGPMNPFGVTFRDAAQAVRCALEVDLLNLPSRSESFFITVDLPQDQCRAGKATRLLGWEPKDNLEGYWRKNSIA